MRSLHSAVEWHVAEARAAAAPNPPAPRRTSWQGLVVYGLSAIPANILIATPSGGPDQWNTGDNAATLFVLIILVQFLLFVIVGTAEQILVPFCIFVILIWFVVLLVGPLFEMIHTTAGTCTVTVALVLLQVVIDVVPIVILTFVVVARMHILYPPVAPF